MNNNQKHGLFFKTANPRHLQDYPGIFAVQQEHKIKDGREMVSNLAFKPAAMSDIYARLSLSSSYAEQLFLKAFGVTPVGYRTQLRMARARELLVASRLDVKQVARRVGFGDPLYFSRAFRKHFGMPPSRLVREYRPNWTESRSPLPSPRSETV